MVHFDESEVREIEIDDRNYPELLKTIKNHRKPSVFVEICHRMGKLLLFLEAEKQRSKHSRSQTESAKCSLNTDIQSSLDLPMVAILLRLMGHSQQAATLSVSFRADSNHSKVIQRNLLKNLRCGRDSPF